MLCEFVLVFLLTYALEYELHVTLLPDVIKLKNADTMMRGPYIFEDIEDLLQVLFKRLGALLPESVSHIIADFDHYYVYICDWTNICIFII